MERAVSRSSHEHLVEIEGENADDLHCRDGQSPSTPALALQPASSPPMASNSINVSTRRQGENHGRHRRGPWNSGFWISVVLFLNAIQIVAAIVVLCLSRHERPRAPLFTWVIGYTIGCFATLLHLYWRYVILCVQNAEQETTHIRRNSAQNNGVEPNPYTSITVNQYGGGEEQHIPSLFTRIRQMLTISNPRLIALVDHYKMTLDCFFALWFVLGNVWVFGGHSSFADAPNLYRLCIIFLAFNCICYATPFILCATICCCLPCVISILGAREDANQTKGASPESINSLPSYKFRMNNIRVGDESKTNVGGGVGEAGVVAAGTDKEKVLLAEDAVCCICLAKYADGDDLRQLPCSHFFHMDCVDKWLKINGLCPLCKFEIGASATASASGTNPGHRQQERRVTDGDSVAAR